MAIPAFCRQCKYFSNKILVHGKKCAIQGNNCLFISRSFSSRTGNVSDSVSGKMKIWRSFTVGVGISLAIGGGGYGLKEMFAAPSRTDRYVDFADYDTADGKEKTALTLTKDPKISRKVEGPTNFLDLHLVLFQTQFCPLCCKVRAFLEFYGIPYAIVEVNPAVKKQMKFYEKKKLPILMIQDSTGEYYQLNDSSAIISILATYLLNPTLSLATDVLPKYNTVTYTDKSTNKEVSQVMNRYFVMRDDNCSKKRDIQLKEERKWRQWVDNDFVPVIAPNVYRTVKESKKAYEQFSQSGHWEEIFTLPERWFFICLTLPSLYFRAKKLKSEYQLKEDVRESLYDAVSLWAHALNGRPFMGGNEPNLADLAVYGVLNSFEGCKAFKDMERETDISRWYDAMKDKVQQHSASCKVPRPKELLKKA